MNTQQHGQTGCGGVHQGGGKDVIAGKGLDIGTPLDVTLTGPDAKSTIGPDGTTGANLTTN